MSKQTVRLQRITTEEYDPDDLILSGAALWAVVGLLLLVGFLRGRAGHGEPTEPFGAMVKEMTMLLLCMAGLLVLALLVMLLMAAGGGSSDGE